jgi:hypothetical protein
LGPHYGPAEKNQEKVKAICIIFSVLASQSVESLFAGKTKNSKVDNFLPEFDIANSRPF